MNEEIKNIYNKGEIGMAKMTPVEKERKNE